MTLVDLAVLGRWMDEQGLPGGDIEDATELTGGTQNVLIRFRRGGTTYVLRRPPLHLRPRSNDNLRREARVLGALTGSGVAAPALLAACPDETVMGGAAFLLMENVVGFNPGGGMPELHAQDPAVRREMGLNAVTGLAELGAIDHDAVGLSDFGRPEGFLERQVPRWLKELDSYSALDGYGDPDLPGIRRITDWLDAERPGSFRPGIMHGDFHLANLLFSYDGPGLAAIVDWEMATIGDPLLDLGWFVATWPTGPADPVNMMAPDFAKEGQLAGYAELVERYAASSTRDLSAIQWYAVLACFKLGIVLEGSYARACAGKFDPGLGDLFHGVAVALMDRAEMFIDEGV